jgi:Methyltransferase domain
VSLLWKIRQVAMLRHFRPRLVVPAARTMMARESWRKALNSECEWQELFARGRYSAGGSVVDAGHLWWGAFKARRTYINDYLELGSWEGQSTLLAAWLFPKAQITAVDWFANADAVANFDHNTAPFKDRIDKVKGTTWEVLSRFSLEDRRFDLIFIDADHRFDSVLLDTILSWPMVRVGGCLIWDDYLWSHPDVPMLSPKRAIDTWLATRWKFIEVVFAERQVCVRKLAEDPSLVDMAYKFEVVK